MRVDDPLVPQAVRDVSGSVYKLVSQSGHKVTVVETHKSLNLFLSEGERWERMRL